MEDEEYTHTHSGRHSYQKQGILHPRSDNLKRIHLTTFLLVSFFYISLLPLIMKMGFVRCVNGSTDLHTVYTLKN